MRLLGGKNNIDAIKNIFAVKDDDLIIDASQPDAMEILLDKMNKIRGERTFFMFLTNYAQVGGFLVHQNFAEGVGFLNAMMFLSERHGMKLSYSTQFLALEI